MRSVCKGQTRANALTTVTQGLHLARRAKLVRPDFIQVWLLSTLLSRSLFDISIHCAGHQRALDVQGDGAQSDRLLTLARVCCLCPTAMHMLARRTACARTTAAWLSRLVCFVLCTTCSHTPPVRHAQQCLCWPCVCAVQQDPRCLVLGSAARAPSPSTRP